MGRVEESDLGRWRTMAASRALAALARINYRLDARNKELEELLRIRDEVIAQLQQQVNAKPKVVDLRK